MKFIKDIIGEKRERVRLDGHAAPEADPAQAPVQDAVAPDVASTGAARPPLSLDRGFLLDAVPETAQAASPVETAAPLAGKPADDGWTYDAGPDDALAEGEGLPGFAEEQPQDPAIAAFFAREQETVAVPAVSADPRDAGTLGSLAGAASDDPFAAGAEAPARVGIEDSFRSPELAEPAAESSESYRVFKRTQAGVQEQGSAPEVEETPSAAFAPVHQPQQQPEISPRGVEAQPASILAGTPQPAAPAPQAAPVAAPQPAPAASQPVVSMDIPADASIDVPAPSMGRGASRAGRVKTRLLGFSPAQTEDSDPFARSQKDIAPGYTRFPVGWLAIVQGPGRGAAFTLFSGVTVIGRGADQTVRLDFGDNSISRDNHAAIAYDPEQKAFYIGHGGKANLVRRNNRPVLSTETLAAGDVIRIGETTLRFVPLCGADFGWDQPQPSDTDHAVHR
ncbi:FHA domain-containing protein [Leisingera sp. NJS204]|uniref:FHA domain-containing protein n=1 Tax=Leisingera sp. NJS204 TaxID=2508307 RepID=UPI0020C78239|nr:FHA domain-containing protein [Leisingera sp. NJS204]